MAVYSYASNASVSLSSIENWHNSYEESDTNVSMQTIFTNLEPADSAPHSLSELRGTSFLYGDVLTSGTGTVRVTSGYSGQGAASSFKLKNVNFDLVSSVVLTADAVYPNYLEGWYSGPNGTGTLLADYNEPATTGTLTLTESTFTSVTGFYAYFVNAHL